MGEQQKVESGQNQLQRDVSENILFIGVCSDGDLFFGIVI
jgi:hypothetical protein